MTKQKKKIKKKSKVEKKTCTHGDGLSGDTCNRCGFFEGTCDKCGLYIMGDDKEGFAEDTPP